MRKLSYIVFFLGLTVWIAGFGQTISTSGQLVNSSGIGNSTTLDRLSQDGSSQANQSQVTNLLEDQFVWNPAGEAKLLQTDGELSIIVDTDSNEKLFNRAYLETQLNSSTVRPPVELSLVYAFRSVGGENATLAIEIRDRANDSILSSNSFDKNATTARFGLSENIFNKPIEVRLYVITEEAATFVLIVREVSINYRN